MRIVLSKITKDEVQFSTVSSQILQFSVLKSTFK